MAIHSDWGDWLPREIEDATPDGVSLWSLGCNGFAIKAADGTTLFVDPYLGTGDPPRTTRMIPVPFEPADVTAADAVLATHEHTDHVHGPSQAPILANTDAAFYAPDAGIDVTAAEDWTGRWDVADEQLVAVEEGDVLEVGSFSITVEPAHDPDAEHPVSYVIAHEAGTVFHGGDTKPDEVLDGIGERHDVDLGILAFGTVGTIPDRETGEPTRTRWYADENGVIEAANRLRIDRLLPSHWDMWKGLTADPTSLHDHARSFPYPRRLEIAEIGDRVDL